MEQNEIGEQIESKELTFWVCYKKDDVGKCNYLGDGNGHIRLFKSEEVLNKFLDDNKFFDRSEIVVHPIKGLFAIPEPEIKHEQVKLLTLNDPIPPSASEVLANHKRKRKRAA